MGIKGNVDISQTIFLADMGKYHAGHLVPAFKVFGTVVMMKRKALTEKGFLKLIESIKSGEALDSQHRLFRGYNITITKAHCSAAEERRWYYKRNPEAVEKRLESQRKLRAFRRENRLCLFCGAKARKRKGKTFVLCNPVQNGPKK